MKAQIIKGKNIERQQKVLYDPADRHSLLYYCTGAMGADARSLKLYEYAKSSNLFYDISCYITNMTATD